jgi:hypothetical protein
VLSWRRIGRDLDSHEPPGDFDALDEGCKSMRIMGVESRACNETSDRAMFSWIAHGLVRAVDPLEAGAHIDVLESNPRATRARGK